MGKLNREQQKDRELREKLEKIVQEECAKANVVATETFYLFRGVKNTGESLKMPEDETIFKAIAKRYLNECGGGTITRTYRNLIV